MHSNNPIEITQETLNALNKVKLANVGVDAADLIRSAKIAQDLTTFPIAALEKMRDEVKSEKIKKVLQSAIDIRNNVPKSLSFSIEELKTVEAGTELKFTIVGKRLPKIFDSYTVKFFLDESYYNKELAKLDTEIKAIQAKPSLESGEDQKKIDALNEKKKEVERELIEARHEYADIQFVFMTKKFEYTSGGSRIFFKISRVRDVIEILQRTIGGMNNNCKCYLIPNHD